jgi:hypothetical protein
MRPDDPRDFLRRLAWIALAVVAACSVTGWAHTAHELNALVAYQPVGCEALRLSKPSPQVAGRVRQVHARRSVQAPTAY